jgi:hypothetical protein
MTALAGGAAPAAALLILGAACLGGPRRQAPLPPVSVAGSARDLHWLAGDWAGEFASSRDERQGSIAFSLRGGRDTAQGRVVFTGPTPPPGCTDAVSTATARRATGEIVLTFARVDVGDRRVAGWLRPYADPELGCEVDTWFEGEVWGDTLAGMYFSHPADAAAAVRLGTWWVARRR